MALITYIDKVPLFDTVAEAIIWGAQYNLSSYHRHTSNKTIGYMAGNTHEEAVLKSTGKPLQKNIHTSSKTTTERTDIVAQINSTTISSGGGGSSSGGGY
mgnify:CR=1 FL=1